jgi:putative transposase
VRRTGTRVSEIRRQRVRELAQSRVRFGYRRILMLLRREGWDVGKDRLYRVYREECLGLRRKRPWRHVSAVHREVRTPARHRNDVWSMDFVSDELTDGRRFRALTVVDVFTRECLDIEIGQSLKAGDVVCVLERLKYSRGVPARIYSSTAIMARSSLADKLISGHTPTA